MTQARVWQGDDVPRLRDDVVVRRQGSGERPGVIEDPTFHRRYQLDPGAFRVVRAVDGKRTVDQVLRRANLGSGARVTREMVHKVLAFLDEASLLVPEGGATPAAPTLQPGTVRLSRDTVDASSVDVLAGARFTCQGSGMCCGGYTVGPVQDDVAARIAAHAFDGDPPHLRGERFQWTTDGAGRRIRALRAIDGVCVFLDADRRCRVHRELGADAKPASCRAYPLELVATPDGRLRLGLNGECGGLAAARFGQPLEEQIPAALELAATLPVEAIEAPVVLDPDRTVDWPTYRAIEDGWMAELDHGAVGLGGVLRRWAARWAGGPPTGGDAPLLPADRSVVEPVLERLLGFVSVGAKQALDDGEVVRAELLVRTRLALGLLLGRSEVVGDLWEVASRHRTALPGTRAGDVADALGRFHLRQAVFLGRPLRSSSLGVGLGWLSTTVAVAGAMMPVLTAHGRRLDVDASVVAEAFRTTHRTLRPSVLGVAFEDDDAPLLAWARALADEGQRTD